MAARKNLYDVLGVARDADADTIRKAYRALARKHHPDVNPGDAEAEARFKEISEAYAVLSDSERRRNYDEFGEASLEAGFDAEEARKMREAFGARFGQADTGGFAGESFSYGDLDDLLSGLFGGGGPAGARGARGRGAGGFAMRGSDVEAELELDFLEAARGTEKRISLARPGPDGAPRTDTLSVRIPPGTEDGARLRLRGKGGEGLGGGPAGDLYARVRVRPHPFFRREGRDLYVSVPVTVSEATLGAKVEVPTLEGRATVTVPAGTDGGSKLRLRGKGIRPAKGAAGDLYAEIQIRVPRDLDDEGRSAVEKLARFEPDDPRRGLGS